MSRRADKRIFLNPPVAAVINTGDRQIDAIITDICSSGLGFQTTEQFKKGSIVIFELNNDENVDLPDKIKTKIKNEYENTENHYVYGAKIPRISHWYERNRIHNFVYAELKKQE